MMGMTVVLIVVALFAGSGSNSAAVTLAALVIIPGVVGVTTMVTATVPPLARSPMAQVMGLVPVHVPWVGTASPARKVTPPGSASVMTTLVAIEGPALVATSV
jgi:hypothetical protein